MNYNFCVFALQDICNDAYPFIALPAVHAGPRTGSP
jgi:hypothetical protein